MSTQQSYKNHAQYVFAFHVVLFGIVLLTLIGAGVNLYQSWGDHERMYSASLIFVIMIAFAILMILARVFALKAQDRAIRAEENLRHFVLTGKLLPASLSVKQIVALRFAPDAEFPALAAEAAAKDMAPDAIKQSIKTWKPDTYRV
ncbi:MAG: hypothetical protein IT168_17470 [Bryobacterales bacterium]|nr:hypothetical protein [Bryobacterales bacterium]